MKSSLPPPTKAQKRRMGIIKQDIGCIVCHSRGLGVVPADAHHILSGGRRISHDATIPLCKLHHDGYDAARDGVANMFEPSLADSKRDFIAKYGTELALLAETDRRVAEFERSVVGGVG